MPRYFEYFLGYVCNSGAGPNIEFCGEVSGRLGNAVSARGRVRPVVPRASVRRRARVRSVRHWARGVSLPWQIIHLSPTLPPSFGVIDSWQTTADRAGSPHALRTRQLGAPSPPRDLRPHPPTPCPRGPPAPRTGPVYTTVQWTAVSVIIVRAKSDLTVLRCDHPVQFMAQPRVRCDRRRRRPATRHTAAETRDTPLDHATVPRASDGRRYHPFTWPRQHSTHQSNHDHPIYNQRVTQAYKQYTSFAKTRNATLTRS